MTIYELIDYSENIDSQTIEALNQYAQGLKAYRNRDWVTAVSHFQKTIEQKPEDGPAKTMKARCERFITDPPGKEWDGAFSMDQK